MSSEDQKVSYFSTRVRIADVTSPKDLVGFKELTVEITFGNQDVKKIIKNKQDLADIEERTLFDEIEEIFKQRDKWAKERGFMFVDQVGKTI